MPNTKMLQFKPRPVDRCKCFVSVEDRVLKCRDVAIRLVGPEGNKIPICGKHFTQHQLIDDGQVVRAVSKVQTKWRKQ